MLHRATLVGFLLLLVSLPALAQTEAVEVELLERTYLVDPEKDNWTWGLGIVALVKNNTDRPVSGLVVYCSMQDARGKEVLWTQQAAGTIPPNSGQRVKLQVVRKDPAPSKGIPGLGSSKSVARDDGLADFKALKPVLSLR